MTDNLERAMALLDDVARRISITDAYQRGQIAERARIVAWLFDQYDSGSVDGLICRSNGPDDFAAMLAQETKP